jgi:hypothetical protein
MASVIVLNTPENQAFTKVAEESEQVRVRELGPYVQLEADEEVVVDRRATGVRHAVWYSAVAGLDGMRIVQWDKDAFRAVAR